MTHAVDWVFVLWWMAVVEVAVHVVSLPALARWIGASLATTEPPSSVTPSAAGDDPHWRARELRRLRLVDVLARRWPFGTGPCLRQALVAGRVLRRHHPVLRVGAALSDAAVIGHAWLEVGTIELGRSDEFAVLVSSPRR